MAKVTYMDLVDNVRGKFCKKDEKGSIFVYRPDLNTRYVYHRHAPVVNDPSPAQLAQQQKFASAAVQVKTIMADNEQLATYREAFAKQDKYKTLRGYIFADVMAA